MAIESQGTLIKRISTAAGSSATSGASSAIIASTVSTVITRSTGSFVADGFTTAMRITFPGSTLNTGAYGVRAVAATAIALFDAISTFSTGDGTITVQGNEFTPIAGITGWNGPDGVASEIDVTDLDSTAKEFIPGLRDEGSISLDVLLNTDSTSLHSALQLDRANRTQRTFEITYTDYTVSATSQPSADVFDGYVLAFTKTGAVDDAVKGTITLRITGAIKQITGVSI